MADQAVAGSAVVGTAILGNIALPDTSHTPDRFQWEGQCWERVVDPDVDVALVRGENARAQEEFAARLANILRLNVSQLYVTQGATINEAVIGRLWADMFTARKVSASEIVANAITADKIAAGAVTAQSITASEQLWAKIGTFAKVTTDMLIAGNATITNDLIASGISGEKITAGSITGDRIAAGSISTSLIEAGAITGSKIAAGTITGSLIAANAVSADKVTSGSFEGKTFVGGRFQGGEFQSPANPANNIGGVAIDPVNGLRGWDSAGNKTFQLRPSTGQVDISANLLALNEDGRGVILVPTSSAGGGGLWFTDTGSVDSQSAAIWRSAYSAASEPLQIRGANGSGVMIRGARSVVTGNLDVDGQFTSGNMYALQNLTVSNDLQGNYRLIMPNLPTSGASSANLVIGSTGYIGRTSSSRRYKDEITDWTPDVETVLKLRPRTWTDRYPLDGEPERRIPGFIAEEVHDLGLTPLVTYSADDDGNLRPESLNYDRFPAAQHVVLVDHETRINQLEEQLAALMNGVPDGA